MTNKVNEGSNMTNKEILQEVIDYLEECFDGTFGTDLLKHTDREHFEWFEESRLRIVNLKILKEDIFGEKDEGNS